MKIIQVSADNWKKVKELVDQYVHLESQPYGQREEQLFNIAVREKDAKYILGENLAREIKDTGRTAGFWQHLGGRGVFSARTAFGVSEKVRKIVKNLKGAEIFIRADTWAEIVERAALKEELKKALFDIEPVEVPKVKKSIAKKPVEVEETSKKEKEEDIEFKPFDESFGLKEKELKS